MYSCEVTKEVPSPAQVREQLARILSSSSFSRSDSLSRFLAYIVEAALEDRADEIKETVLGIDVFGRGAGFDPRIDPIVRVTARKLRERLERYYQEEGRTDVTAIELPKETMSLSFI
jgi:serine/threonine-protein kinase